MEKKMIRAASETYKTNSATIRIDEEGILCVHIHENAEVDEKEVQACFNIYRQLGCEEDKVLELIFGSNDFTLTKEGSDLAAKHGKDFFIACALITTNLAVRLVFNFYTKIQPPDIPFRMFKSEAEARAWLNEFRSDTPPKKSLKKNFLF